MTTARPGAPNPGSVTYRPDGQATALKVHRARWSGTYPDNSRPAVAECLQARVARTEIDVCALADDDFLVVHNTDLADSTTGSGPVSALGRREAATLRLRKGRWISAEAPPLLSEVVALLAADDGPTVVELDLKDEQPLSWARAEELARIVAPARHKVVLGSCADWNLRRLHEVDPELRIGLNPQYYLDYIPAPRVLWRTWPRWYGHYNRYGYLDRHPLARVAGQSVTSYLTRRFADLAAKLPTGCEMHLRLLAFERMLRDGFNAAEFLHAAGQQLDVWTLDARGVRWSHRLERCLTAGVDVVTTNTAARLAAAWREAQPAVPVAAARA